MTKKYLHEWYYDGNITYSEKEILNKMGVDDCSTKLRINDLKKIIWCKNLASEEKQINEKLSNQIRQIIFFTPDFDINQTCAIVIDNNSDVWVVAYRSFSRSSRLNPDLVVVKVWNCSDFNEAEKKSLDCKEQLNSDNPILTVATDYRIKNKTYFKNIVSSPYVFQENLILDEIKNSPDQYIKPLNIIKVNKGWNQTIFVIYLGKGQICNYTKEAGTYFDTWQNFTSVFDTEKMTITQFHPIVPFKRREEIIRHMAKAVNSNFGKGTKDFFDETGYNWTYRNDEHFVNRCVYGINFSQKVSVDSNRKFNLQEEIKENNEKLDSLTSADITHEVKYIEKCIQEVNQVQQIEQDKFETHILVRPKTDCKIQ